MKKLFSKIAIVVFTSTLLTSCMAIHSGYMTNSTALSQANFEYVSNNIQGSESVTYILGIGGMAKETLVDNAKKNMLQRNPLKANQALANLTLNIITTNQLGIIVTVTCTVTADIVEFRTMNSNTNFSENRTESSMALSNKKAKEHISTELTELDIASSSDSVETVNPSNTKFPDSVISDNIKYSIGDDIIYTFNGKPAIIEEIIRDKYSRGFNVKIKFKKNNKMKFTSIENIVKNKL